MSSKQTSGSEPLPNMQNTPASQATDDSTHRFLPNPLLNLLFKCLLLAVLGIYIALSWYNHPSADDWSNSLVSQNTGLSQQVSNAYSQSSGRFVNVLISHYWLSNTDLLKHYWISPVILILLFLSSIWIFLLTCLSRMLTRGEAFWWALLWLICYTVAMPHPREAYYWMSGAHAYSPGMIIFIWLATALAKILKEPGCSWMIKLAAAVLAGMACGFHELLVPPVLLAIAIACIASWRLHGKIRPCWPIIFSWAIAAALATIMAPGNFNRAASAKPLGSHAYLAHAAFHAQETLIGWITSPLLISAALLAFPLMYKLLPEITPGIMKKLRLLLIAPAIWLLFLSTLFLPSFMIWDIESPYRVRNLIFWLFLFGGATAIPLLLAYAKGLGQTAMPPNLLRYSAAAVFAFSLIFASNATRAARDLLVRAAPYDNEIKARYELIRQAKARGESTATVPAIHCRPWTIFFSELNSDPQHWANTYMGKFFGLKTVILAEPNRDNTPGNTRHEPGSAEKSKP